MCSCFTVSSEIIRGRLNQSGVRTYVSLWTIMCLKSYFNARVKKYTANSHEKDKSDNREVCTTYCELPRDLNSTLETAK